MYDAVNRGMRKARGEIIAYINCDEQYLPGALKAVEEFFARNPEVEGNGRGAECEPGSSSNPLSQSQDFRLKRAMTSFARFR